MRVWTQLAIVAALTAAGAAGWQYRDQLPFGSLLGISSGPGGGPQEGGPGGGGPRSVAVDTERLRTGDIKISVEAVGTALANEAVEITSKVSGIVEKIRFQDGQIVKSGDIIVELGAGELQGELEEDRADRDIAKRLYERARTLLKTNNVPESRVEELQGKLEAAEARVRAKQAKLAEYVVRAPFDGRLGIREISLGALVTPGTRVTTLDDTSVIKLDFEVPETALSHLKPGLEVTASGAAFPDRVFFGTVATIDSRVDPVTRTIRVQAEVPNTDEILKPGMFLTVELVTQVKQDAVLAPEEAVISLGDSHYVFAVEGDKAIRRPVTLGQRLAGEVEIVAGLEPDAEVIVGGIQKVSDGTTVRRTQAKADPDQKSQKVDGGKQG
jgi:membrane fusion protein (multidrug efflux system)